MGDTGSCIPKHMTSRPRRRFCIHTLRSCMGNISLKCRIDISVRRAGHLSALIVCALSVVVPVRKLI